MRLLDLALKDLLQILKDRKTAVFLVAIPIAFTLFFNAVFGGQGAGRDPRLPVGFVNGDPSGPLGAHLLSMLEASDAIRPVVLDENQAQKAREQVRDAKLAAALILPEGAGEAVLAAQQPKLTLIVDANSSAGQTVVGAVDAAVTRLLAGIEISQLSTSALEGRSQFADEAARRSYLLQGLALASSAWRNPSLSLSVEFASGAARDTSQQNTRNQTSAGSIIQFTIYALIMCAGILVAERKSGALQRLLTTPITRTQVIAGHTLGMLVVILVQQALLMAFGQLAFRVPYLRVPLATALVAMAYALWVVSFGMLIGAVSKTDEQVIMWSLLAMFIFSALGGAWFSLEFTGKTFSTIGHLTPAAWAMDGFQNILQRGLGLGSVLLPVGILLAYAAATFALAVWRFRFE